MIKGQISDRKYYQQDVRNSISQSWTGKQMIIGPFLVIPYKVFTDYKVWNDDKTEKVSKTSIENKYTFVIPDDLSINSEIEDRMKYKGIYQIPVYTSVNTIAGKLTKDSILNIIKNIKFNNSKVEILPAYLSLSISDPRGINKIQLLEWNEEMIEFIPGSKNKIDKDGVHALIPNIEDVTKDINFNIDFSLRGMEQLSFAPTGKNTTLSAKSLWPHPEFIGDFLPYENEITDKGYKAKWMLSSFSFDSSSVIEACAISECENIYQKFKSLGVRHVDPVNVYLKSERSVKYALLFIGLSFVAFFLFEILRKLPIHPIQYTLVGLSLSIFYLLLLSLSEHISFGLSYLISMLSCTFVLAVYLKSILKDTKVAAIFSAVLLLLYSTLYVIINAEDFALLMGAGLTFIILTIVLFTTRKIDWYALDININKSSQKLSRDESILK